MPIGDIQQLDPKIVKLEPMAEDNPSGAIAQPIQNHGSR
jgi:hypothetical protein